MKTNDLRKAFLDYFKQHGHTIVSSSSLIPANDPTLLFTNAGMVQFKDVFLGQENRPYKRASTAQRCVRAGGKHNDLENVGYTARHHTFFEMLGNFSFGDYFKRDAIYFAWNFLTQVLKIPKEKLWVTVFENDDEAADIWLNDVKIDPARFSRCGEKDNFWAMGDTGPCGPCTELFYDHGPGIPGGPPGSPDADGDRYIEIWNLVFMQFNRTADGQLHPLPKPSVDTGMGLERIAAVLQGVHSNYEIDIFVHLIKSIATLAGTKDLQQSSLKVIADHIRSTAFLITDGVIPSNEGRGYVLRRIIRRAIRHGNKVGFKEAFLYKLVKPLVTEMGEAYPELAKAQDRVSATIKREEEQFAYTLEQGLKVLEEAITQLPNKVIPGSLVFKLYDTYGFPPDLTADIARERQLSIDYAGFEQEMEKQRKQSQASSQFAVDYNAQLQIEGETEFTGYEQLDDKGIVRVLIKDNQLVDTLYHDEQGIVILDRTPFYAEAGGQVGDTGQLFFEGGVFEVKDTQKQGLVYLHHGVVKQGTIRVGTPVNAEVSSVRIATMLNHSATHLLHAALRRILGEHVIQKGSLVAPDRLRFDFAHFAPMTPEEIKKTERLVNQQIQANLDCHIEFMTPEEAKKTGAMALFGEKYGDEVRVLSMGEFSVELCGGTHTKNTGQIGLFKIIGETGIAGGIRRIEAITGEGALNWVDQQEHKIKQAAELLKTSPDEIIPRLEQYLQEQKNQEQQINHFRQKWISTYVPELITQAKEIAGIKVIINKLDNLDVVTLRTIVDQFKERVNKNKGVIILTSIVNNKAQYIVGVTPSATQQIRANEVVAELAKSTDGKGGGRPDLAQGGTEHLDKLKHALEILPNWLQEKVLESVK